MIAPLLRLHQRLVGFEGSTRSAGLMRIALALLAWSEHGARLRFLSQETPAEFAVSGAFWISSFLMLIGWKSRLNDLRRIHDLRASNQIDGMYTLEGLGDFRRDLEAAAKRLGLI